MVGNGKAEIVGCKIRNKTECSVNTTQYWHSVPGVRCEVTFAVGDFT